MRRIEYIDTDGSPYLTRIDLTLPWFRHRYYLHIFSRPDADRVFHDHPGSFTTIVLWGGYDEESHVLSDEIYTLGTDGRYHETPTGRINKDVLTFLSMRHRESIHAHRITRLHTKKVITLFIRDKHNNRDWGFWCPPNTSAGKRTSRVSHGWLWVYWRDYLGL